MEAKDYGRVTSAPIVEGGNNGRFVLEAEYRQGVVNYVFSLLIKLETDSSTADPRSELVRIATSFEDKMYRTAKTLDEYYNGLIRRLSSLKLTDRKIVSSTSNSGNHLSLQNLFTNSQALAGNTDRQRMNSNIFAEMKREILDSAQQFVSRTQEFQKSSMRNQEYLTQNLNLRAATGLHHNPNNLMQFQNTTRPIQQENCMQKRAENEMHHRNQQQRTQAYSYQHPRYSAPCNLSEVYQQQQMIKSEIDALNMRQQMQQSHSYQQTRAADVRQQLHTQSQPLQVHVSPKQEKRIDPPRESSQLIRQNQLSFGQSRIYTDQPNKLVRENVSPGVLSEPMELTGVPNIKAPNRNDEAYSKVQRAKGTFLPYLCQLYSGFCARRPERNIANSDEQNKYKVHVEGMIKFLQLSRSEIEHYPLDWVMDRLQTIFKFIKGLQMKKSECTQNHSHPGSRLQTPSAVQLRSSNHQERSENIASATPAIASSFQISSPRGEPSLPLEKPDPYQSGRGRQNYMQPVISTSSSVTVGSSNALNPPTSYMTYTQPGSALISSQRLMQQHQHQPERRAGKQSIQQNSPSSLATLQHHHSETLESKYPYQSLLPTNLHQSQVIPSDVPHKQSQKGLPESLTCHIAEAGRILRAVPSIPPIISSPRAPMHTEEQVSGALTFGIAESPEKSSTPGSVAHLCSEKQTNNQGPANDASELEKSSILPEVSNNGDNTPQVEEEPIQLLTKLVKTIKHEALSASAQDIAAIISMGDRVGSSGSDETRVTIGEDFSAKTRCRLQALDSISRCPAIKGMKHHLDATSWELHTIKRPRLTPNFDLLEEIRNINRQLLETIVDVMFDSHQQPVASEAGEGTLIRCLYTPAAAAGKSLNTQHASRKMLPTLVLRLLVPPNYHNSLSSILVDGFSTEWKGQESKDFLEKAKANFSRYLQKSAEKTSLEEMIKAWNACAREVFYEFASAAGGGCFSSKYGKWENCVTATLKHSPMEEEA